MALLHKALLNSCFGTCLTYHEKLQFPKIIVCQFTSEEKIISGIIPLWPEIGMLSSLRVFFILMSFRIEYTALLQFHIAHITLTKYNSQFHKVYKYNVCPSNMSICVITCQSVHKICTMLYQKSIPCISIFIYIFNHPTNQIWVFYILWKKIRLFSHIMITS